MTLTPTQQRFYDLLKDGAEHRMPELIPLLWDEMGVNPESAVRHHISDLRKLVPGHTVVCRGTNGQVAYRMVRFISAGE